MKIEKKKKMMVVEGRGYETRKPIPTKL